MVVRDTSVGWRAERGRVPGAGGGCRLESVLTNQCSKMARRCVCMAQRGNTRLGWRLINTRHIFATQKNRYQTQKTVFTLTSEHETWYKQHLAFYFLNVLFEQVKWKLRDLAVFEICFYADYIIRDVPLFNGNKIRRDDKTETYATLRPRNSAYFLLLPRDKDIGLFVSTSRTYC